MIKKHLLTCSVIIVLVTISKLFICSTTDLSTVTVNRHNAKFIFRRDDAGSDLSFANEAIPVNDPGVRRKLRYSLKRNDFKTIQSNILHRKAQELFPIIEPILQRFGIPDDFKYIPLVESGLSSGTSPRGAAGLWQFMPGTARVYGLKVGHGVDERRNVRKSTIAACRYIKGLYAEFHNWTLTAAAYNNGSIKLARAMRQQGKHSYYHMHLNRETGIYVYNLIAMKEIINYPNKYGYKNYYNYLQPADLLALN